MGYSNLAYKYEEDYSFKEEAQKKVEVKAEKVKKKNFTPIICALVLSMAAYYMISKNVELYETNQNIKSLQNELRALETYTSQRIFELEQSEELAKNNVDKQLFAALKDAVLGDGFPAIITSSEINDKFCLGFYKPSRYNITTSNEDVVICEVYPGALMGISGELKED